MWFQGPINDGTRVAGAVWGLGGALGVHGLPPMFTSRINEVFEKQKLFAISVAEQR